MSSTPRIQSDYVDPAPLAQPLSFTFSGRSAPNRFLKGAMSERLASWSPTDLDARGIPSPALIKAYSHWGEGKIGLLLTGNVMIEPDQLESAGNLVIPRTAPFSGERFERFHELASVAKAHGSLIMAQVSHPGRQSLEHLQPYPISASDVPLLGFINGATYARPRAATKEDIAHVVEGFAHAAEYLDKAGFDGIQLHGAHGYLLSQFLSPTTNKRTDEYGGSLENRMRLVLEIRNEIARRVRKDFVIGIKINSVEFQESGFQPDDAKELCGALEENRFDFVELSGGTYENWPLGTKRESTIKREAFFLEFARLIVPSLSQTKSYVTGGLKTVEGMINALETVDGVGLGRALCQEPRLCSDILIGKVTGAIQQKLDMSDFGLTVVAAGVHIRQMGHNLQPINLGLQQNVETFSCALAEWAEERKNDQEGKVYQFFALPGYDVPYATTIA